MCRPARRRRLDAGTAPGLRPAPPAGGAPGAPADRDLRLRARPPVALARGDRLDLRHPRLPAVSPPPPPDQRDVRRPRRGRRRDDERRQAASTTRRGSRRGSGCGSSKPLAPIVGPVEPAASRPGRAAPLPTSGGGLGATLRLDRTDVAVVIRPVLSEMPPGTTLRVELLADCRGSELRADVTAEQEAVHARVWQDGVHCLERGFNAPRRTDIDLLAEAIEAGGRDPVAVGALGWPPSWPGGRCHDRQSDRERTGDRDPARPGGVRPDGRRADRSTLIEAAIATAARAHWATTGGSTPARDLPPPRRAAAARSRRLGAGPPVVGRRAVRAGRPPAVERQDRDGRPARDRRAERRVRDRRLRRRRRRSGGRPGRRSRPRTSTRSRRGRRSARASSPIWAAAALRRGRSGPGPDRRAATVAGVRPGPPRDRAGRPRPVGLPGLRGVRHATSRSLGVPAPTHVEPHVARVTLNPRILDVARRIIVVAHGAAKADDPRATSSAPSATSGAGRPSSPVAPGATWILDEAAASALVGDGAARPRTRTASRSGGRRRPMPAPSPTSTSPSFHATYDVPARPHRRRGPAWIARGSCRTAETWVAEDDGRVVAMMVVDDGGIDQLYVEPARLGQGIGGGWSTLAKERSPGRPDALHVPGQRARPTLLRAARVRRRVARRRLGNEEGQPDVLLPLAARDGPSQRPASSSRGRHADRGLLVGRRAAARPRPRRDRRPHDVADERTAPRPPATRSTRSTAAAAGRPATAPAPTRSSASSRTWPRSPTRSPPRPAARSMSSATRTAAASRSGRRC